MAKWLKTAGVYYRQEGSEKKMYKRGDVIIATEEELKQTDPTLNSWKKIADDPEVEAAKPVVAKIEEIEERVAAVEKPTPKTPPKLTRMRRADGKIDVVNVKSKKKLNDVPLTEKEADSLIADADTPKKRTQ